MDGRSKAKNCKNEKKIKWKEIDKNWKGVGGSVTRWLDYFCIFGHL